MCIHVHSLIGGSTWQPCLQSLHLIGPAGSCSTKAPSLQAHLGWNNKAFPHFPPPHCPPCIYSKAVFTSALKICNSPAAGKRVYHLALCPENKMLQKVIKKSLLGKKRKKQQQLFSLKVNWVEGELSSHAVPLWKLHTFKYVERATCGRMGWLQLRDSVWGQCPH